MEVDPGRPTWRQAAETLARQVIADHERHSCAGRGEVLDAERVDELIERMRRRSGRRLHVVLDGTARENAAVSIRTFVSRTRRFDDLVELDSLTRHAARLLAGCVAAGLNIVVSGGTQAGSTPLLKDLVCEPS